MKTVIFLPYDFSKRDSEEAELLMWFIVGLGLPHCQASPVTPFVGAFEVLSSLLSHLLQPQDWGDSHGPPSLEAARWEAGSGHRSRDTTTWTPL